MHNDIFKNYISTDKNSLIFLHRLTQNTLRDNFENPNSYLKLTN